MVPDAEDLEEVLLGTTKALKKAGGREYKSGQACKLAFRAPYVPRRPYFSRIPSQADVFDSLARPWQW
jgi:hypothetical protein